MAATIYDLLVLKDLEKLNAEELAKEQPTTPDGYNELAAHVISQQEGTGPVDVIIPGHLLLGSRERARDREFLASIGVTDVLVMAVENGRNADRFKDSNIRFWKVVIPDILGFPLIGTLRAALHTMLECVFPYDLPPLSLDELGPSGPKKSSPNNRCLFVHCTLGISRSGSFVIFYILYRLFIDWPEDRPDGPSITEILSRIQDHRPICPNVAFLAQLRLLADCLTALLPYTQERFKRDTLRESRILQFNTALLWSEAYFDTETRVMAECMSFIMNGPLSELESQALKAVRLGLSAWSLKSSPLKHIKNWIPSALVLENFNIYAKQLPSGLAILSIGRAIDREPESFKKNLELAKKRMGILPADEGEDLSFPALALYGTESGVVVDWVHGSEGGLLKAVNSCVTIESEAVRPKADWQQKLPKGIIGGLELEDRLATLRFCMGLPSLKEKAVAEDRTEEWAPEKLMEKVTKACLATLEALGLLTTKFDCTAWSVWIAHKASQQSRRLWNSLMQWQRSHEKVMGQAAKLVVSSEEVRAPPDPRGVSSSGDEGSRKRPLSPPAERTHRKKVRYETTDVDTLRREVARMRRNVNRLKGLPVVSTQI